MILENFEKWLFHLLNWIIAQNSYLLLSKVYGGDAISLNSADELGWGHLGGIENVYINTFTELLK